MTCGSCVSKVKKSLSEIQGVSSVEVKLEAPQAKIEMTEPISLKVTNIIESYYSNPVIYQDIYVLLETFLI